MALEVIFLVCCIISFCMCMLSCAFAYPVPTEIETDYTGFKQIASGRALYDADQTPSSYDTSGCAQDCSMDWTCKGFNSWIETDSFGLKNPKCIKSSSNVSPWMTIPAYMLGKNSSNIFVRIS